MTRKHQRFIFWTALTFIAAMLMVWSFRPVVYKPYAYERISDNYKLGSVKTYEVFETDTQGYVFIMVRLKTGEEFPMVCRSTSAGITPTPQSVFVEAKPDSWTIMCELGFALTSVELSKTNETLYLGKNRLSRSVKLAKLL